jgi:hypothetical protein
VLAAHLRQREAEKQTAGEDWVETGLVFTQPDGTAYHPADVIDHFTFLTKQAGLPRSGSMTCVTALPRSP